MFMIYVNIFTCSIYMFKTMFVSDHITDLAFAKRTCPLPLRRGVNLIRFSLMDPAYRPSHLHFDWEHGLPLS